MLLVILFYLNLPTERISTLTGFCKKTVRKKIKILKNEGFVSLFIRKEGVGRKAKTNGVRDEIEAELESHDYRCVRQIKQMIADKFNIVLSLTAIKNFLKNLGFKYLKSGSLPAKADPEKQRKFYDETLHPLMKSSEKDESILVFLDGAHFVLGCNSSSGAVWSRKRRYIKSSSGRQRWNVLGALDFKTKQVHTVSNDSYITATQVVEMLEKLSNEYINMPIHVILDNARYQHCKIVQAKAAELGISLHFLPTYSPNLNLIERLWRLVKKELSAKYYFKFEEFVERIEGILRETHTTRKDAMDTLIGEKVQLFDNLVPKSPVSSEFCRAMPAKAEESISHGKESEAA